MAVMDDVKQALGKYGGKWSEKKGLWDFSTTIAERKGLLSKKKLTYSLKMRVMEEAKTVKFSEMLAEASAGFSSGGDLDGGFSSGFGVKKESYNTFGGSRQGAIEEQAKTFGKDYTYQFDYQRVRSVVQGVVEQAGYCFEYQTLLVK